jgi:hypothetical protein
MSQVLSRIFRVPVDGKPITILELTGLPPEVVNVVVSVLCRMAFDFALWGEGKIPVTLVCEEAHRYVPLNPEMGFEPCKRAIAKIAKEGRKYGASLCIVTQRPAEIDPTILSQCNTVFALRMSNDRDQAIVASAVADTGTGLIEFLPALGAREAIAFGDGVPIPVRIKFDELPPDALPRSTTAQFSAKWQESLGDEAFLEAVIERWRAAGVSGQIDSSTQAQQLADAVRMSAALSAHPERAPAAGHAAPEPAAREPAAEAQPMDRTAIEREVGEFLLSRRAFQPALSDPPPEEQRGFAAPPRREPSLRETPAPSGSPDGLPSLARSEPPPVRCTPEAGQPDRQSNARMALRERLLRPHIPR